MTDARRRRSPRRFGRARALDAAGGGFLVTFPAKEPCATAVGSCCPLSACHAWHISRPRLALRGGDRCACWRSRSRPVLRTGRDLGPRYVASVTPARKVILSRRAKFYPPT